MSTRQPRRLAAGASLLTLAITLTACGGPAESAAPPDGGELELVDSTPAAASQLPSATWLIAKEPTNLDLSNPDANDPADLIMANVCERLNKLQPDMSVGPGLASTYEWRTPTELVFTIRDNATFHSGAPVTTEDVLWSMQRNASEGHSETDEFVNVLGIEQSGPQQITFTMKQPDAVFVEALAGNAGLIQERAVVEAAGDAHGAPGTPDACSGPLQLADWTSGSQVVLEKAENYWDTEHPSMVDQITFQWAADDAIVNSLLTGAAQGAYIDNISSAARLIQSGDLTVAQGPDTRVWSLLATERGGLANPDIRKALSLALDRDGINRAAFAGLGKPWKEPVGPGAWGYEQELFSQAYDALTGSPDQPSAEDIAEAKDLVAAAGPTEPIVVATDSSSIRNTLANAVVDAAQKIGLEASIIQIPTVEYSDFYDNPDLRLKADLWADDYYISKTDPVGFYKNGASTSEVQWVFSDPAYDQLVQDGRAALDPTERARIAIELAKRWADAKPWISAVQSPNTVVMSADVTGVPASGSVRYYPWAADLGQKD